MIDPHAKTPLVKRLLTRIAHEGAITFRDWMATALYDKRGGYYRRPDLARWGRAGDYRTSVERTPLFAATFARYFAALHEELGAPSRWTIYEAGAGACDFARVLLDTLSADFPQVFNATRYVIDEINDHARSAVHAKLASYSGRVEFRRFDDQSSKRTGEEVSDAVDAGIAGAANVRDAASMVNASGVLDEVGIVFSNELIDALPVHRVVWREGRLRELCVGLDAAGEFAWVEREPTTPRLAEHFARFGVSLIEGQRAEVNLAANEWLARAAFLFSRGFVVTVDYGARANDLYDPRLRFNGTLRAFRAHALSDDLLAAPGARDLTATINWSQLEQDGRKAGLENVSLERQDRFLLRVGALEQLELMCARAQTESERASLRVGAREMILPGGMGESFQVLVQKK